MLKIDEIIDFFKLERSHAKKELGQNFLIKEEVAKNIVNSLDIQKEDKVLEIGPGLGALTDFLVISSSNLTLVEYDQKFVNFLTKAYENYDINIVKNNILKFRDFTYNKVIGNLPYYITSDIIEYICLNYVNLDKAVFMIQKECLKRFTSKSGKDYNALNVLVLYLYEVEELFKVTKENFFPIPNVESIVFSLKPKKSVDREFAKLIYKVAKICFSNRRKTIQNNLSSISKNKDVINTCLKECGLSETARAEQLNIEQFINLTLKLAEKGIIH